MCVLCFSVAHVPCDRCMRRRVGAEYRPILDPKTKKPANCARCNNERYLLDLDRLRRWLSYGGRMPTPQLGTENVCEDRP